MRLGDRPLPSCLGGGDLDGDLYNLIPLNDPLNPRLSGFQPTKGPFTPSKYSPAPKKLLSRQSTMRDDVADFVLEYIDSDVSIIWLLSHVKFEELTS